MLIVISVKNGLKFAPRETDETVRLKLPVGIVSDAVGFVTDTDVDEPGPEPHSQSKTKTTFAVLGKMIAGRPPMTTVPGSALPSPGGLVHVDGFPSIPAVLLDQPFPAVTVHVVGKIVIVPPVCAPVPPSLFPVVVPPPDGGVRIEPTKKFTPEEIDVVFVVASWNDTVPPEIDGSA